MYLILMYTKINKPETIINPCISITFIFTYTKINKPRVPNINMILFQILMYVIHSETIGFSSARCFLFIQYSCLLTYKGRFLIFPENITFAS